MNKKDKLIKRFKKLPRDFTYDELVSLFNHYGFIENNKGSTSGSRVEFVNENDNTSYIMHKPHPGNIIKGYSMKQVYKFLENNNYLNKENKIK